MLLPFIMVMFVLYRTWPGTTWYCRMPASWLVDRLARFPPIFWKAALLGMKQVRSGVLSSAWVRLVFWIAPTAEVRLRATPVAEMFCGRVRKRSITWIVPLSNGMEALTTEAF